MCVCVCVCVFSRSPYEFLIFAHLGLHNVLRFVVSLRICRNLRFFLIFFCYYFLYIYIFFFWVVIVVLFVCFCFVFVFCVVVFGFLVCVWGGGGVGEGGEGIVRLKKTKPISFVSGLGGGGGCEFFMGRMFGLFVVFSRVSVSVCADVKINTIIKFKNL